MITLRALAPYIAAPRAIQAAVRCELCTTPIAATHRHVIEIGQRGIRCVCPACALLFASTSTAAPYRTVPSRFLHDSALALTPERWATLGIPVGLAYFVDDSPSGTVIASYPGPAGIVDGELSPEVWQAVRAATPLAEKLVPDVEALLVRGDRGGKPLQAYLVPISTVYELAGRLRSTWRGFTGGDEAQRELDSLFEDLTRRGGHI